MKTTKTPKALLEVIAAMVQAAKAHDVLLMQKLEVAYINAKRNVKTN